MVGGRKEEGGFTINNSNVFAALDTLKKKKNKDKKSGTASSNKVSLSKTKDHDPQVFWQPTPLKVTSWADVDEEDDDDYYATAAPLSSAWAPTPSQLSKDPAHPPEESESEDDMLDLGDDEVEEDHEHETEAPVRPDPVLKKAPETPAPPKEAERQLSKKERKKKELAELEALLADFGVSNDNNEGAAQEKKTEEQNKVRETDNGDKKDGMPVESKSAKKKKKKDKTSKEAKESEEQPNSSETGPDQTESLAGKEPADEDTFSIDVKERLKKLAALKKKKSSKEMDGSSKAAALEAAARNARLAAAKKKEKNHYNQQPVR
ncbi:hypothetical protein KSS87_004010 [Heliosperma pusillum]|nr:hypothetical protein KSS87_004010 [Heliosperma pusillum]